MVFCSVMEPPLTTCPKTIDVSGLSAESFPTKIRSTGRGVCVATGRLGGFFVQFTYGPLINQNRLSYMLGLAGLFGVGGLLVSWQTKDTTNINLQDHWDYSTVEGSSGNDGGQKKRTSFAETTHSKYLSIE